MSNSVFPQQKPSMSLEQAMQQTMAHCQAGRWQEAEILYQAILQAQPSPVHGQYWLSYIDALIKAGKPRPAVPAVTAVTVPTVPAAQTSSRQEEIPASIKLAKPPNPCHAARRPAWPWKMALGCGHVPGRTDIHLLLARYRRARYAEAETMARSLTRAFPLHDLCWKVLVAALRMQGRAAEAQQAQQQRGISHAGRRKNVQPA